VGDVGTGSLVSGDTVNVQAGRVDQLRKIIKTRGHFPSGDVAARLPWLRLPKITAEWRRAAHDWKAAMRQFAILYEDRFIRPNN
jgi:transposase-like protein